MRRGVARPRHIGRPGRPGRFDGQGIGAGGLAGEFGEGHAVAAVGDADVDALADGGGALHEDDEAGHPGDAFGRRIFLRGLGDDDIHFGAGQDKGGGIAGARRERPRGRSRQRVFRQGVGAGGLAGGHGESRPFAPLGDAHIDAFAEGGGAVHEHHEAADPGNAFGGGILLRSLGNDDVHFGADHDGVAGEGLEHARRAGRARQRVFRQGVGAGGLAGGFGEGDALQALDDADIDAFAEGGHVFHGDDQAADPGDPLGVGILFGGFGDDNIHLGADDDGIPGGGNKGGAGADGGRIGGQRLGAGGLAGEFGEGHALAPFGDAHIDAFADGGGAVDEHNQAGHLGDAFGRRILLRGLGDDDVHFGAGHDMAGGVAGPGNEGGARRFGRQVDGREHLDQDGVHDAVAHAGDVHEGGLAAAGARNEGGPAADLGDAGGAVVAFIVDENLVAVAHFGNDRLPARGIDELAGVDVGGGGGLAGNHHGDHAFFPGMPVGVHDDAGEGDG